MLGGDYMQTNIVIKSGMFYDGSTKVEIKYIEKLYSDKEIVVHMILPGEAHITLNEKVAR